MLEYDSGIWRESVMILKASLAILVLFGWIGSAGALTYVDPNDRTDPFRKIVNDSIPAHAGERIVTEGRGVVSPWLVALIDADYETVRREIEALVEKRFGVDRAYQIALHQAEEFKPVDPDLPQEPLFGDAFSGFHRLNSSMKESHEYIILSKPFNRSDHAKRYSVSKWRIGDGMELVGRPWTIIVVGRTDYSREWARDHMGIVWPFKLSGATRLVTDTEVAAIDSLADLSEVRSIDYFVPYPGFQFDGVLKLMRSIVDRSSGFKQE